MNPGSNAVILYELTARNIDFLTISIHSLVPVSTYTTMVGSTNTVHLVTNL